jgi:hypothetical protein
MSTVYILCAAFVALMGFVGYLLARELMPPPAAPAPLKVPPGCIAVILSPDHLSEIHHGLVDRLEELKSMNEARPSAYFRRQVENAYAALDAIAEARGRAG